PQQVFVDLAYTPWIYRLQPGETLSTHTGMSCGRVAAAFADDDGNLLLETDFGIGALDDRDLTAVDALLEYAGERPQALGWRGERLSIATIARANVAQRFGFEPLPR